MPCPLENFIQLVHDVIPEDIKAECGFPAIPGSNKGDELHTIYYVFLFHRLDYNAVFLFIALIYFSLNRKI